MVLNRLAPWAILIALVSFSGCNRQANVENTNELALGASSKVQGVQSISLKRPIDLSGISIQQITDLRKQLIDANHALLQNDYKSWAPLFSRLKSDAPWVSIIGLEFDGLEQLCGEGNSFESTTILNPFILISPHFTGISKVNKNFEWDPTKVSRDKALAPDFPLMVRPISLEWKAKESFAKLTLNMSDYLRNLNSFQKNPVSEKDISFHLIGYNASDFNFHYLAYAKENTTNITFENPITSPVYIRDILVARKVIQDGPICNAASYPRPEMLGLKISALPAQLTILLWKAQPADSNAAADMTFVIAFN